MLAKIILWSGRNPFLVLLATLFIVVGGVTAVLNTPLDALPDLSDVQVIVYTEFPGPNILSITKLTSSNIRGFAKKRWAPA